MPFTGQASARCRTPSGLGSWRSSSSPGPAAPRSTAASVGWFTSCWTTWSLNNHRSGQRHAQLKLQNHLSEIPSPELHTYGWRILQLLQNLEETIKAGAVGRTLSKRATSLRNKVSAGSQNTQTLRRETRVTMKCHPHLFPSHREQGEAARWFSRKQNNSCLKTIHITLVLAHRYCSSLSAT